MIVKTCHGSPWLYQYQETKFVILYIRASIRTYGLEISTLPKYISTALTLMLIKATQLTLKLGLHYKSEVITQKYLLKTFGLDFLTI